MATSAPKPRNITKADLERWSALESTITEFRSEANSLAAEQRGLEAEIEAFVNAKAGPERSMIRCGYELAIRQAKRSVPWKNEFVARLGAAAAKVLEQTVGTKDKLEIKKL